MPRKPAVKKTAYKKRNYRRKVRKTYSKFNRRQNNILLGKGLPNKITATLKYCDQMFITSQYGAFQTYQFNLNGLYDPNYTQSGHQPMYFDQFMALYNHYHVIGCKWSIRGALNAGGSNAAVGYFVNDDTSIVPDRYTAVAEQGSGYVKVLDAASNNTFNMSGKWSAKKTFGTQILANNALQGTVATNPTETSVITCFLQALDQATTNTVQCIVQFEYLVVFHELKDIGQS